MTTAHLKYGGGMQAHDLGGAYHNQDTLANVNTKVSDATLVNSGAITNADIVAAAGIAVSKLGATVCEITTGTYSGDGSTDQGVTGVGFQPKFLWIIPVLGTGVSTNVYTKFDNLGDADNDFRMLNGSGDFAQKNDEIISFDADGFSVDDGGADAHPNKNGQTYAYIAIG